MFKSINGGTLPKRQTRYSSGFDVFANKDVVIGAGETKLIGLGIAIDLTEIAKQFHKDAYTICDKDGTPMLFIEFKERHYLELHIRSSLRVKGLTSLGTGIIDIDYPDEIKIVVHNPLTTFGDEQTVCVDLLKPYTINKGDKIGQLILKRHEGYLLPQEYTLDAERNGGFGSTGA